MLLNEYLLAYPSYSSLTGFLTDLLEVDIEALRNMKMDEFLSCFPGGPSGLSPVKLALAKALYRSFFNETPASRDSYDSERTIPFPAPSNGYYPYQGVLNFRSLIKSSQLPNSRFITSIPIEELKDRLERYTKTEKTPNLKALNVVTLDLSFNELVNEDLGSIIPLVMELECPVVKLRFNRLGVSGSEREYKSANEAIEKLLKLPFIRFIDISGNNIIDINNKPFFDDLSDEKLCKLIFVLKPWLQGLGWRDMIENETRAKLVFATHCLYFSEGDDPFFKHGPALDLLYSKSLL